MRALLLVVVVFWCAAPANAQGGSDLEKAASLYQQAEASYKLQKLQEALEGFQQSYALSSEPSILFNIGQCQRQLGLFEDAKRSFQFFMRDAPKHPKYTNAERLIAEIDALLEEQKAKGSLKLTSSQDPASVFVDGVYRGESPVILLGIEPGVRAITIKKKGFADSTLRATVEPAQTVELRIPQLAPSIALLPTPLLIGSATSGGASLLALGGVFFFANQAFDVQSDGKLDDRDDELALLNKKMSQAKLSGGASVALAVGAVASFGVGILVKKRRRAEAAQVDNSLASKAGQP